MDVLQLCLVQRRNRAAIEGHECTTYASGVIKRHAKFFCLIPYKSYKKNMVLCVWCRIIDLYNLNP